MAKRVREAMRALRQGIGIVPEMDRTEFVGSNEKPVSSKLRHQGRAPRLAEDGCDVKLLKRNQAFFVSTIVSDTYSGFY